MVASKEERIINALTLLRGDAQRLFERIAQRRVAYMAVFSTRRTRDHFPEIFTTRYPSFPSEFLIEMGCAIITSAHDFYSGADDIKWYLMTTQDMPATVQEKLGRFIQRTETCYHKLSGLIDEKLSTTPLPLLPDIPNGN